MCVASTIATIRLSLRRTLVHSVSLFSIHVLSQFVIPIPIYRDRNLLLSPRKRLYFVDVGRATNINMGLGGGSGRYMFFVVILKP